MNLIELLRRRRATKGYGVHSPLAFRLLKHVIRPQRDVVYYGEEKLARLADVASGAVSFRQLQQARVLLRFVAELQPAYVWMSAGMPQIFHEAVRMAGCVVRIYDGELFPEEMSKADMIVAADCKLKKTELRKIMVPGKSMISFGVAPKKMDQVRSLMKGGVILDGKESIIAVNTRDCDAHIYSISRF